MVCVRAWLMSCFQRLVSLASTGLREGTGSAGPSFPQELLNRTERPRMGAGQCLLVSERECVASLQDVAVVLAPWICFQTPEWAGMK